MRRRQRLGSAFGRPPFHCDAVRVSPFAAPYGPNNAIIGTGRSTAPLTVVEPVFAYLD